ncbi:MAG: LamG-like jellyroll fold domain-containing protein [Acidimicrobiales bacterium]
MGISVLTGASGTTIGGLTVAERNVISMNFEGIEINTDGNVIEGNFIGTDATGLLDRGNDTGDGVEIQSGNNNRIGGANPGEGNLVAFNQLKGIDVTSGAGNTILGNDVHSNGGLGIDVGPTGVTPNSGVDAWVDYPTITAAVQAAGTVTVDFDIDLPAGDYRIEAFTNPGGADPSGNGEGETHETGATITHTGSGVESFQIAYTGAPFDVVSLTTTEEAAGPVFGATSEFSATFTVPPNGIEVNSTGDAVDATPGNGACDTGGTNSAGATECTLRAAIDEANALAGADTVTFSMPATEPGHAGGIWTISPGSELPTLTGTVDLDGTTQTGWTITPVVEIDGTSAGAFADGLRVFSTGTTIQGFAINRFEADGIEVDSSASGAIIQSNHIGLDPTGLIDRGNIGRGIDLQSGSFGSTVGGGLSTERNVISGNGGDGIVIWGSDTNTIIGNLIGTDVTGNASGPGIGNGADGIAIGNGSDGNIIGTAGSGNVLSGNANDGLELGPVPNTTVRGNMIGIGRDGSTTVPNGRHGIVLYNGSNNTQIGGPAAGEGNTISSNTSEGVHVNGNASLTTVDNTLEGNRIGTDSGGTLARGNGSHGVNIFNGASATTIGGIGAGNLIAHNGGDGVLVGADAGSPTSIVDNSIHQNGGLGIDLAGDGVTVNDAGDADGGPNGLLNHAEITTATIAGAIVNVTGTFDVPAGDYRFEFYRNPTGVDPSGNGEGEVFAGTSTLSHSGAGPQPFGAAFPGVLGDQVSITLTEVLAGPAFGPTSEFSVTEQVVGPMIVNSTGDSPDASAGDGVCDTGALNSASDPECTLRAAIEEVNASVNLTAIEFQMPDTEAGYQNLGAGNSWWSVQPSTPLPVVTSNDATIDGRTQATYASAQSFFFNAFGPSVELDGSVAGGRGLEISASDTTVQALVINRFVTGLALTGGSDNVVVGNYVGADVSGLIGEVGNTSDGVLIAGAADTIVGGTTVPERNVISGNRQRGVWIEDFSDGPAAWSSGTRIIGNYIGVDANGAAALPYDGGGAPQQMGIAVWDGPGNAFGEPAPNAGNVISGNSWHGVYIWGPNATANTIQSNILGLDSSASGAVPNGTDNPLTRSAITLSSTNGNLVGGVGAGEGNTISGNAAAGVTITSSVGNSIIGNTFSDNTGLAIDLATDGVTLNDAGDIDAGPNDLLNFPVVTGGTESGGTVTVDFTLDVPAGDYRIELFTNPSGPDPSGHGEAEVFGAANTITHTGSGTEAFQIAYSGTGAELIALTTTEESVGPVYGSTSELSFSVAAGSFLVNSTGNSGDANPGDAICDTGGTNANGDTECTLRAAIEDANATSIVDVINFAIPVTDPGHAAGVWTVAPLSALPAASLSVAIDARTQTGYVSDPVVRIDGLLLPAAVPGLVITPAASASTIAGLALTNIPGAGVINMADSSSIVDNHIGVEPDGVTGAGGGAEGISVIGTADGTILDGNQIGGHGLPAIVLSGSASATVVTDNLIGTDSTRTVDLGNAHGVWADTSGSALIGGTGISAGNTIRNSSTAGIHLANSGPGISVLRNSISSSNGLGIDLAGDGPTLNDAGDIDTGANDLLNFPEIVNVRRILGSLIADVTLDAPAGDYRIELFANTSPHGSGYGEGETWIGATTVTHTGSGPEPFTVSGPSGATILTATATRDLGAGAFGPSSEFSLAVPSPDLVIVNSTGDSGDAIVGDGQCDTGGTNSAGDAECTLRAAIEEANDVSTPVDTIWFDMPASEAGHAGGVWTISPGALLPPVAEQATIDATTQSGYTANSSPAPLGLNSVMPVVVDGGSAGPGAGLTIAADGSTVRGLVVAGFDGNGVELSGDNTVLAASYVGVDAAGLAANTNIGHGVAISGDDVVLGGLTPADRVLVSGNDQQGVEVTGARATVVGAIVGVDANTTAIIANGRNGIRLNGAIDTVIGSPANGNVISGNDQAIGAADGIFVSGGSGHTIAANLIGTNDSGANLGNFNAGVAVSSATDVLIGGPTPAEANIIAFNGGDGVQITGATSTVSVIGNSSYLNGDLGIDLGADGPTVNDAGDGDSGANALLNAPLLGTSTVSGALTTVDYTLDAPSGTYRLEFFVNPTGSDPSGFGEGDVIVASTSHVHAGGGSEAGAVVFPGAVGQIVTATATVDLGALTFRETSEFSNTVTTTGTALTLIDDRSTRRSDLGLAGGLDPVADGAAGIGGRAFDFDGVDDRLIGPGLDLTDSAFTLTAWVNPDTIVGNPRILSKSNGIGEPLYDLALDGATGEAVFRARIGGTPVSARGGTIGTAAWTHLAATADGTDIVLYVDGVEVDRTSAPGVVGNDVTTSAVVGNNAVASEPFDGLIDDVRVTHSVVAVPDLIARNDNLRIPSYYAVGAEQTSTPGAWTTSSSQTRSGSFALSAPETTGADAAAWAVATGIDEPGVVFESWWWISTDTGIDLASGTRADNAPTDEYEAALVSPSGWQLRQRQGVTQAIDAPASGVPSTGAWMKVEIWTDQLGDTRLFIDGVEEQPWTAQGSALISGSMALRAGLLPTGQTWYVDDARGRKLITPEPLTSLGSLDRN